MAQYLFPNPAASMVAEDYLFHFEFLGRVLAKAVFEDILVEPQFSPVFLNKLLGRVRRGAVEEEGRDRFARPTHSAQRTVYERSGVANDCLQVARRSSW